MHIVKVYAGPETHAEAHRRQDNFIHLVITDTDTADIIYAAFYRREPLEDGICIRQVIDEYIDLGQITAGIESDRRT